MFEGARRCSKMLDAVRRHSRTVEGAYSKPVEGVRRFVICYLQTGTTDRKSSPSFRLAALADRKYLQPFRLAALADSCYSPPFRLAALADRPYSPPLRFAALADRKYSLLFKVISLIYHYHVLLWCLHCTLGHFMCMDLRLRMTSDLVCET